jgi:hypothetical protein
MSAYPPPSRGGMGSAAALVVLANLVALTAVMVFVAWMLS